MTVLGAYNFDEASGSVLDRSGNGHAFTLSGNSIRDGAGHTANGARSTSTGTDAGPALFGQTTSRTLMMWLKMSADFTGWCFEQHLSGPDSGAWGLLCLSGQLGYRARNAGGNTAFASAARVTDNAWHHYAGTWDGTSVRFYTDGVLTSTVALTGGGPIATADVCNLFNISVGTPPIIDDVRVFDVVLNATDIATYAATPVSDVNTVLGTANSSLAQVSGTVVGKRTVAGLAASALPTLSGATAVGKRTVNGVLNGGPFARVTGTVLGAPVKLGTAFGGLPGVSGAVIGRRSTGGTAFVDLPGVLGAGVGSNPASHTGTGSAVLGGVIGRAVVYSPGSGEWLTQADLDEARLLQESIMYDKIRIRHDDPVNTTFDPAKGYAPTTGPEPFYDGKARVQARPVLSRAEISGGQQLTVLGYVVAIPWHVTGIRPTDVIEIYSSRDPEHPGKIIRVQDVQSSTFVTARRVTCIATQAREPVG